MIDDILSEPSAFERDEMKAVTQKPGHYIKKSESDVTGYRKKLMNFPSPH